MSNEVDSFAPGLHGIECHQKSRRVANHIGVPVVNKNLQTAASCKRMELEVDQAIGILFLARSC